MHPVMILLSLHFSRVEITYGVVPEAAIPITTSLLEIFFSCKSSHPCVIESSAFSIAFLIAVSPPAINP